MVPVPAMEFRHSTGILLTQGPSHPSPDLYSFVLGDGTITPRLGWGRSGWCPVATLNPPEGDVTTVHYAPPQGTPFTDADQTALAALIAEHRDRYNEVRIYITPGIPNEAEITRWVSGGSIPGTVSPGWETSTEPEDSLTIEEQAA